MKISYELAGPSPRPMTRTEIKALKDLVPEFPPNAPIIIQIGAGQGVSTLAIVEANPHAFILSIDTGPRGKEFQTLREGGFADARVVRALGRSQRIGNAWPSLWSCDLLFVDGDHRYQAVRNNILAWVGMVNDGGTIAFHDYILPEDLDKWGQKAGVYRAVNQVKDRLSWREIVWADRLIAFRVP